MRSLAGGRIRLRGPTDDLPQQWWFASTAIPLIVASLGPLSHVLSLASWVSTWRMTLPDNGLGPDNLGVGIPDPQLELTLNMVSLAIGFTGNFFLLLHFKSRVRYVIALPVFVSCWLLSSAILIGTIIGMWCYAAPIPPAQIWSQGFWHAIFASGIYFAGSVGLLINMVGYLRGHYPQQFALDDDQRTLIQQSMMFFFWVAGCAAIFSKLEGLTYPDALYYADVSILTIGFGDIAPKTEPGRAFLFLFQLVGIIFLGIVISSISRFATNISADKIFKQHQRNARQSTLHRTVTNESELRERLGLPPRSDTIPTTSTVGLSASSTRPTSGNSETTGTSGDDSHHHHHQQQHKFEGYGRRGSLAQYGHIEIVGRTVTFHENKEKRKQRRQKLLLLQEEKDRFDAMRQIQDETRRWKQYWALAMSFLAFGILWCLGAFIFMKTEARIQNLGYFDCLYFCFVALLTIGYGDIAPKSNIGKPFFIVWSLIAVPIVTFLITEMSKTVITAVTIGTAKLTDWTLLLDKLPIPRSNFSSPFFFFSRISDRRKEKNRIARGFQLQNPNDLNATDPHPHHPDSPDRSLGRKKEEEDIEMGDTGPTPETPVPQPEHQQGEKNETEQEQDQDQDLARQLSQAIKTVSQDLANDYSSKQKSSKRYTYAEWRHFTKLMRFTRPRRTPPHHHPQYHHHTHDDHDREAGAEAEWDWIGEDSPMLADVTEPEFVLARLCESLERYLGTYMKQQHR